MRCVVNERCEIPYLQPIPHYGLLNMDKILKQIMDQMDCRLEDAKVILNPLTAKQKSQ